MRTRIISGLVMVAIGVAVLVCGGYLAGCFLMLISLVAYYELCNACKVLDNGKKINSATAFGYVAIIVYYAMMMWMPADNRDLANMVLLVLIVLAQLAVYVFTFPKYNSNQIMSGVFGLLYAPFMLSFMYKTMTEFDNGKFIVFLVFVASSFSDAFAYFVGVALGKHKLAPKLSPKKSIEGAVGGILGAALVGVIYGLILYKLSIFDTSQIIGLFALIGGIGSIISQIGDLAASAIKRDHDIKDYGNIIPGHGGIMDRFDSIIVTTPIIYYLALVLVK